MKRLIIIMVLCLSGLSLADEIPVSFVGDVDHLAFRAAEKRQHAQLKTMLRQGLSPNVRAEDGTGLLMYAALHGDAESVRILLEAGANPNATNGGGATALIYGASDVDKVRLLVDAGADVNAETKGGSTALTAAAGRGSGASSLNLLIEAGATYPENSNLLVTAVRAGNSQAVGVVLKHFEELTISDRDLVRIFNHSAGKGHKEMLISLRDWAASQGHQSAVETMGSGLKAALKRDDPHIAKFLLARDARLPDLTDAAYADIEHDREVFQTLVKRGADIHAEGFRNHTALDYATLRGHKQTEQWLKAAGVTSGRELKQREVPEKVLDLTQNNRQRLISSSVRKSLNVLLKSSDNFLHNQKGCTSCHHQHLPSMAASIAQSRGLSIPRRGALMRMNQRLVDNFQQKLPRIYEGSRNGVQSIGYRLWSLTAQGIPANPVSKGLVWWMGNAQLSDGRWQAQNIRTPSEDGDHQATALGIRALAMYPLPGREEEFAERIERGRQWLEQTPARKHTQEAFRLLGLAWANADPQVLKASAEELLKRQRSDGGWAQLVNLESDSWATGLALMAVHAAGVDTTHPAYQRGMEFLLRTQFEDGSWFVRSRSIPVVKPHFDTGFPFGWDQWISAAGTAVASAALALALEPAEAQTIAPTTSLDEATTKAPEVPFVFEGERTVDFQQHLQELLEVSCLDCHSGDRPKGNFTILDRASLMKGGESGRPTFALGRGEESLLVRHVTNQIEDMEMPPLDKRDSYPAITPEQVEMLTTWINEGAVWPDGVVLEN